LVHSGSDNLVDEGTALQVAGQDAGTSDLEVCVGSEGQLWATAGATPKAEKGNDAEYTGSGSGAGAGGGTRQCRCCFQRDFNWLV